MILLDYRDKRPLYEQVEEKLEHLIVCGVLKPNTKMPSVRTLAMELSINPNTIQRAYSNLEQAGFLYAVVGKGNFVSPESNWQNSKHKTLKNDLSKLMEEALAAGMSPASIQQILDQTIIKQKEGQKHD